MIYGYARVSTGSQSEAGVALLKKHGAAKVFREVAQGDQTDRAQPFPHCFRKRNLLNTLAAITGKKAAFHQSLAGFNT